MPSLPRLLVAALLITGCSIPVTVNGQTRMVRIGGGSARDKLNDLNDKVNASRKLLIQRVGENPHEERASIEKARQELAVVRAGLTDDLKRDKAGYDSVLSNLSDAEKWNESSATALDAELMLAPTIKTDADGQEVSAQQLADVEAKLQAARANQFEGWKGVIDNQFSRFTTLKKNVAAGPARREEAKRRAEQRAKQEAREKQEKAVEQVARDANEALKVAYDALKRYEIPSEEQLAAIEQRAAAVEAIIPTGGQFYRNEAGLLRLYANLNQTDGADRLKAQLGGAIAAKGEAHGKTFKATFKAQPNHCYVFFGEIITWGGQEKIDNLGHETGMSRIQSFDIGFANESGLNDKWKGIDARGVCTVSAGQVSFSGGLQVAGSRNGLRYVVLDFARSEFPVLLATHLNLDLPDWCDPDSWAELFVNPVPGTIGYLGNEPVVLTAADPVGGNRDMRFAHAGKPFDSSRSNKDQLTSTPPQKISFKVPWEFKRCPEKTEGAMPDAPLSRQIAQCEANIEKKYAGAWADVDRRRDAADRLSGKYIKYYNPAAEEKASRLRDAYDRDWDAQCKPIEEKAKKTLEARFNKLVDLLTDKPPVDTLKRADLAAAEEDAPYRRWR
ncbi:MAG: hypothetical protein JNM17_18585 [Archangium sp.]|nr:hypothetical protein [Archangium sp.]